MIFKIINIIPSLKGAGGCKYICILFLAFSACQPKEQTQKENLPYYNTADFTPKWYTEKQLDTLKLHKIADFSFIDQDGNIYLRYYHIYNKGDIEEEITRLQPNFKITNVGWEVGNWWIILKK